jgi:hypothetical protein
MKMKKFVFPVMLGALGLAGCSTFLLSNSGTSGSNVASTLSYSSSVVSNGTSDTNVSATSIGSTASSNPDVSVNDSKGTITLKQNGTTTDVASGVTIDNANNQITISALGTYVLTGSLTNGNILITAEAVDDSNDTVELVLNGVSITTSGNITNSYTNASSVTSSYYPGPIYSQNSCHLKIKKYSGSSNVVDDERTSTSVGDDNAAIFGNKKVKIIGSGTLRVIGNNNNGIGSDTHVEAYNGGLQVSAVNNAVKAHKSVILGNGTDQGTFVLSSSASDGNAVRVDELDSTVTTPKYGNTQEDDEIAGIELKDGAYTIESAGKCLSSAANIYLEGGNGTMTATNGKGIRADYDIVIDNGNFSLVDLLDDGIHSSYGSITINNGTYTIKTGTTGGSGNENDHGNGGGGPGGGPGGWGTSSSSSSSTTGSCQGIKAKKTLTVNGGTVTVTQSYEGIEGYDITMNGGTTYVNSSDDGWNAADSSSSATDMLITINGGSHYIFASGDGLDSNGNIIVKGGVTVVDGASASNNGPVDYGDSSSNYFEQDGGIIVAYGASGMAVGATKGTQNSILMKSGATCAKNSYYVFLVNGEYYAAKVFSRSSSSASVYCSFNAYSNNAYGIYAASSVTSSSDVFAAANFSKIASLPSSKTTLLTGTFSSANSVHYSK